MILMCKKLLVLVQEILDMAGYIELVGDQIGPQMEWLEWVVMD